jgi:hypothetical protein
VIKIEKGAKRMEIKRGSQEKLGKRRKESLRLEEILQRIY